jgi:predicted transcriptional regulator
MAGQFPKAPPENATQERDTDLKEVFRNSDAPIVSAPEVAEALEITQQAAYARLRTAAEDGWVKRKKIGAAAVAWWADSS